MIVTGLSLTVARSPIKRIENTMQCTPDDQNYLLHCVRSVLLLVRFALSRTIWCIEEQKINTTHDSKKAKLQNRCEIGEANNF